MVADNPLHPQDECCSPSGHTATHIHKRISTHTHTLRVFSENLSSRCK